MDEIKIIALCVLAAFVATTLRADKPQMASAVAMAAGVAVLLFSIAPLRTIVETMRALAVRSDVDGDAVSLMLRATGVGILAEFARTLCDDAGEATLGVRIEFGTSVAILAMGMPLFSSLIARVMALLP